MLKASETDLDLPKDPSKETKLTEGVKILLVITDGEDNHFEPGSQFNPDGYDTEYNPKKKKIAEVLKERFAQSDITVIVVGFRLGKEQETAQKQFKVIESLDWEHPGNFIPVDDPEALNKALQQAMQKQSLRCRLQRTGDRALVQVTEGKEPFRLRVTPEKENPNPSIALAPGGYTATLPLLGSHELQLQGGDGLLLNVVRDGKRKGLQRVLFKDDQERRRQITLPSRRSDDNWVTAAHQNQLTPDGFSLRMLLSVEKDAGRLPADPDSLQGSIGQIRPSFVWFDISAPGSSESLPGLRWRNAGDVFLCPAPVYSVFVERWPAGAPVQPQIKAWVRDPDKHPRSDPN